jgi:hypothetical protein
MKEKAMSILGKHCKGYPLSELRKFSGWSEKPENARTIRLEVNGQVVEEVRRLTDEDYVYIQRDFTVTDGIFLDENIIFSEVTPEWIDFCLNVLRLQSDGHNSGNHTGIPPNSSDQES